MKESQNLQQIINFIWSVADDVLINKYLENQYQDVILPMTVLRRLDMALEPTKKQVLETHEKYKSKLENLSDILTGKKTGSGLAFYNSSPFTMKMLLDEPKNIDANLEDYINGFSENVQDIISKFKFRNQLETFKQTGITFSLIEKFCSPKVELSPDKISPMAMGYMFEDLLRRFNEKTNAAAGRHFTPREIIELMTHLIYLPVKDKIQKGTFLVYDPCAGSGAMLTQSKKYACNQDGEVKSKAAFHLYGQENTGEMFAVCKSDMLLKGEDPNKIKFGSTLSQYGFDPNLKFNFMLTNPPYGTSWKEDQKELNVGTSKKIEINDTRFNLLISDFKGDKIETALTSRSNDGQLMFMLHMLSKMKPVADGGSRIASVHNGSALFTGDAGSGESGIRQYIIENDLLECIIQLPNDIFYNTGISTYVWIISNAKEKSRKGKVQLINASSAEFYAKRRKALGSKRNELLPEHILKIQNLYFDFENNEYSKVFDNEDFGFYQITVERPLRKSFQLPPLMVSNFNTVYRKATFQQTIISKEKNKDNKKAKKIIKNIPLSIIVNYLEKEFGNQEHLDYNLLTDSLEKFIKKNSIKISSTLKNHLLDNFSWKNPKAERVIKSKTKKETAYVADPELKDIENVPMQKGKNHKNLIDAYVEKEVLPFAPDAWYDDKKMKVGYEIAFNKYFYKYENLRSLSDIASDILALESETQGLLNDIITN